jgi:cysteine-rich repeat protein
VTEKCDDGNLNAEDGCSATCGIETGFECVLDRNEGPDLCFKLEPLNVTSFTDLVHFSSLYIAFSRPLAEKQVNFSELLNINIPALPSYSYEFALISRQVLEVRFSFNDTVRFVDGFLNFS